MKSSEIIKWRTVAEVWKAGLCMGCGACESVCRKNSVSVKLNKKRGLYFPAIDSDKCDFCGLCVRICPGVEVEFNQLSDIFLDGEKTDNVLGRFANCYIGHASSHSIRYNSTSGGLITALLIHALENKTIDGALVVKYHSKNPLMTQSFIARNPREIIEASGSKYCPASINEGLAEIINSKGHFAVVGLPCHIHAIRKIEKNNPRLQDKILFHFGLFCANNNTYLGTEYFFKQHDIDIENIKGIKYRSEGWPGKITICYVDGSSKAISRGTTEKNFYKRALFSAAFHFNFAIPRCLTCPDQTAELSDISFGDPWIKEYIGTEKIGKSMIIVRTNKGASLILDAQNNNVIDINEISSDLVKKAQNFSFKRSAGARMKLRKICGKAVPLYASREMSYKMKDIVKAIKYVPSYFSHVKFLWPIISLIVTMRGTVSIIKKFLVK